MISILCPTRNRPANLQRMINSVKETVSDPNYVEFVFYADNDDNSYASEVFETPPNIDWVVGPRIVLSEMWNECYKQAKGDILMHCGDDIIFRTPDWNKKVEEAFERYPDRIAFVFGNDGSVHDGNFGTHGFIHRKWVETVGYFVPPYFVSDYNDTWLNDVAKLIGRHVHIDILTEHMHFAFGKGLLDRTHQERLDRDAAEKPGDLYNEKLAEREADAQKLQVAMRG